MRRPFVKSRNKKEEEAERGNDFTAKYWLPRSLYIYL